MEWHINDLSLDAQFADPQQLRAALEPLLQLRLRNRYLRDNLFTSRQLYSCRATPAANLFQAIYATADKNFILLAILWLGKSGPFWDDSRQAHSYDHFEFNGEEVTEQGLGEAARRVLADIQAKTFSFQGIPHFEATPLIVQYGFTGDSLDPVTVNNDWSIDQLETALQALREIRSWDDVQHEIVNRFRSIVFSDTVMEKLSIDFSRTVASRIFELLRILNNVVNETEAGGNMSPAGLELMSNYFAGMTAGRTPLFKPESASNQRDFKAKLTFSDPSEPSKDIFCHWHGKIQTPQIRIHFEWPRPEGQRVIKVVYIGPKISKD